MSLIIITHGKLYSKQLYVILPGENHPPAESY
jgi:hypothetical protein